MSKYLPIDRAIPQQIPYDFKDELPSYTLAEATDNGWIWRIPIGDRYGTGYLYSSKFTSDEEAREKYNDWLVENFDTELTSDRIIKYRPGYYEDYWMGNCLAVGLSSGFVEPLESTGIHIIIKQMQEFITYNSNLKNFVLSHLISGSFIISLTLMASKNMHKICSRQRVNDDCVKFQNLYNCIIN